MPTLSIDNQMITVPPGANVLEAAQALGIVIPHFCYHAALGSVGACRLCAMTFLDGPVKGVQMACMVEAKDGMVVSTLDPAAQEQRAHVIEWLMMHHPHDCPVCDEGGECQLQDMTIASGHAVRRYRGKKRTFVNQQLGPFIEQEMNRCIQCYRCVRTYRDFLGGTDFGVMGSRDRLFFGRLRDGALESSFAGNLVDICPTGVFTDKPYRFKSRHFDLQEAPSICPHCSLGCATIPGARLRELQRVRSGIDHEVNGFFICDRGRFGYGHVNHHGRLRLPRIDGVEAPWEKASAALAGKVAATVAQHGPQSVGFLTSPRASLESAALLKQWAAQLGTNHIAFDPNPRRDRTARAALDLECRVRSLDEIRSSDCIVLAGVDPLNEAPMLAVAIRQAVRRGGCVAILDPRPVELPCAATHLPLPPQRLAPALAALATGEHFDFSRQEDVILAGIAARLESARRPILIGGGDLLGAPGLAALRQLADACAQPERPCGAVPILSGPNSLGGALLASCDEPDIDQLLDAILAGEIRGLVCLEADLLGDHPQPGRVEAALERLEWLAVLDSLPTPTVRRADFLLPTALPAESAGCYLNNEGRIRPFAAALAPGEPLSRTSGGSHPPRTFAAGTPGDGPRPAWAPLAEVLGIEPTLAAIRTAIAQVEPSLTHLPQVVAGQPAGRPDLFPRRRVCILPTAAPLQSDRRAALDELIETHTHLAAGSEALQAGAELVEDDRSQWEDLPAPAAIERHMRGELSLLAVETRYGSELLSSYSEPLAAVTPAPQLSLHPDDAAHLQLAEGGMVVVATELGALHLPVRLDPRQAQGVAIVPRVRGSVTGHLIPGCGPLSCRIAREVGQ